MEKKKNLERKIHKSKNTMGGRMHPDNPFTPEKLRFDKLALIHTELLE